MTISRKSWANYIQTLRDINEEAATKLVQYLNTHGVFSGTADVITVNEEELKPFIDYAYAIVSKYGEASASLAAEMYDLTAEFEGVVLPPAELAPLANYGDVAKAIRGTIRTSQNFDEIAGAVTRWVKMASADTTLHNAERDHAQFAWVPSGETCAFCLTLASRGWQYMSKKAMKGGHAEHIHSNCDCQYTIRHNEQTNIAGYDPDEYLSMYQHAEGSTPQERINSMRRDEYATNSINNRSNIHMRTANMSPDEYARAKELWYNTKELSLPQSEREHVYEEFDNNLTPEEKESAIVSRPIGNYWYKAINLGHNQYRIYDKTLIDKPTDVVDEVLTEMFGKNWRDLLDE